MLGILAKTLVAGKSSPLIDLGLEFANMISEALIKDQQKPLQLHELADLYSSNCDKIIIESCKNEKLEYISGYFSINQVDNKKFVCSGVFYFQNENKKWLNKKMQSMPLDMEKYLATTSYDELISKGTVKFEINQP